MSKQVLTEERVALLKAADLLESEGWIQGAFYKSTGRCINGALMSVMGMFEPYAYNNGKLTSYRAAVTLINLGERSVQSWNDAPGRTKEEVVARLRAAAVHGL
jgi:hypothetical protein